MWRRFLKSNVAYAVGSIANGLTLLLLVPVLINALSTTDYGSWSLYEITIYILITFFSLGLDTGLMREFWRCENDEQARILVGSVLQGTAAWGSVFFCLCLLGAMGARLAGMDVTNTWAIPVVVGIAWAENMFMLLLAVLRMQQRAVVFAALSLGRMLLFMGASVGLVLAGYGIPGALAGRLFAALVMIGVALLLIRRMWSWNFDQQVFGRVARYGLPLLPYNLAAYVLLASDRYMLGQFVSLESVAVYTFAYKVATAIDIGFIRPFNTDWAARRFEIAKRPDAREQFGRVQVMVLFGMMCVGLLLVSGAPLIYGLVAPSAYQPGLAVVPVIVLAFAVWGMEGPFNIGIMLENKTRYMPLVGWFAAIICLLLNAWLIPQYGMWGAAWATVIAYASHTLLLFLVSQRLYPVHVYGKHMVLVVVSGALCYVGLTLIDIIDSLVVSAIMKMVWTVGVMGCCALLIVRPANTRHVVYSLFQKQ